MATRKSAADIQKEALDKIKLSMRIITDLFDQELTDLMNAGIKDLGLAGVKGTGIVLTDALVLRAVTTYCRMNFGQPDDYDRLKASYDEQKAQLRTATGYTNWGG